MAGARRSPGVVILITPVWRLIAIGLVAGDLQLALRCRGRDRHRPAPRPAGGVRGARGDGGLTRRDRHHRPGRRRPVRAAGRGAGRVRAARRRARRDRRVGGYRDVNETIIGVLILATDVTEQVQAKKLLIENEERLRIATEILGLGTGEYDPINDVIHWSEKTVELFGFPPGSKINLAEALNTINSEDRPRVIAAIQWALDPRSKGKYDIEYRSTNSIDKTQKILRANGQVFFDRK